MSLEEHTLSKSLHEFPFNNISTVCRLQGEDQLPDAFGGDCYEQVTRLADQLRHQVEEVLFMVSYTGPLPHFAILAKKDGDALYLDPSLNMRKPVSFDLLDSLSDGDPLEVESYPSVGDESSSIHVSRGDENVICSAWHTPILRPNGDVLVRKRLDHTFALDETKDTIPYDPNTVKAAFKANASFLRWNSLDPDTGDIISINLFQDKIQIRKSWEYGRVNQDDDDFEPCLNRVSSITGVSRNELDEFLELGQARFRELKRST